jgi:hypothetical protein
MLGLKTMSFPLRVRVELEDWLRYSPAIRWLVSEWKYRGGPRLDLQDSQAIARSIVRLCQAARLAPTLPLLRRMEEEIEAHVGLLAGRSIDWSEFFGTSRPRIGKATLLKPFVSERERGVIFIAYEYEWIRLMQVPNVEEFAQRYTLVISPTWSPPHHIAVCAFPNLYPGEKIFTFISNEKDLQILPRISSKYVTVPLYASSLVHPGTHKVRPFEERDIDILMVANFARYKRHFEFFRALKEIPKKARVKPTEWRTASNSSKMQAKSACWTHTRVPKRA